MEEAIIRVGAIRQIGPNGISLICNPGDPNYGEHTRTACEVFLGAGGWRTLFPHERRWLVQLEFHWILKRNFNSIFGGR